MKLLIITGLILCSINFWGQSINEQFSKFIDDTDLTSASLGFSIVSLDSGNEIYGYNQNQSLMTASTLKLVTTATALEIFGKDHTFQTKLLLSGTIDKGILKGDIIIRGEGDPTLGSQEFLKHYDDIISTWTAAIQGLGISEIQGSIIGDDTYFDGISLVGSTAVKDIGNYYGAGAHALSAYENKYIVYFKSPNTADADVEVLRTIPPNVLDIIDFSNEVKSSTINKDNAYIYGIPDCSTQVAKGTIPMNKSAFKIKGSIPDPAKLLAFQLTNTLKQLEISVTQDPQVYKGFETQSNYYPEKLQVISTITSPPLSEIINYTNLKSVNSYANILVKNIGVKVKNEGSYDAGLIAIQEFWNNKGIDTQGWFIEDGSGLSRGNAITALQISSVIAKTKTENRDILKSGLKDFAKSKRRIITKSGYMNRVRSFAGFMTLKDGQKVCFSLIANNFDCSASSMRKKMEVLMLGL